MAAILQNGSSFGSGAAGILSMNPLAATNAITTNGRQTIMAHIANNGDNFFAFVEALKQNNLAKVLADPNIVSESGRPGFMNAGGEIPILVPQSLGTVSIEYRRYGTQIDFVPIVMGNGGIHLEVRPRVSELDDTRSITINGTTVPALTVREAEVGVNMRAGQTLAIAGLVQTRHTNSVRGIPVLMDAPWIGGLFRRTSVQENEIELLIMVTPQLVDGLDPAQLACMPSPGSQTTSPGEAQQMAGGLIEVPPSAIRPPHFQREYIISPQGINEVMPGGAAVPEGVAPAEAVPPPPVVDPAANSEGRNSDGNAVRLRRLPPVVGEDTIDLNTSDGRQSSATVRSAPSRFAAATRNAEGAEIVVRRETVRDATADEIRRELTQRGSSSPSNPVPPSEPGLIGPIGYDVGK
jgi:pilus assembly protein CpaC